jgi:hypothetical protein
MLIALVFLFSHASAPSATPPDHNQTRPTVARRSSNGQFTLFASGTAFRCVNRLALVRSGPPYRSSIA